MPALNKVFLIGNLTRDPEVRQTPSGRSLCKFGLAVNRGYTTAQGEEREETCFVDVEAWGSWAEACGKYLRKGGPVFVEGRLRYDQWEDRDSGERRSRLLVQAERGQFLGGQPGRGGSAPADQPGPQRSWPHPASGPDTHGEAPPNAPAPSFEEISEGDDDIPF